MFLCPFQQFLLYSADDSETPINFQAVLVSPCFVGYIIHLLSALGLVGSKSSQFFSMPLPEEKKPRETYPPLSYHRLKAVFLL